MKKASILFLFCLGVIEAMYSQTQNEFVLEPYKPSSSQNIIESACKENGHRLATVVFYTTIKDVKFETVNQNRICGKPDYDEERGCYVLCLRGVDEGWRYIQIDIKKDGFIPYQMEAIQIKNGEYMAYKLSPKFDESKKDNVPQKPKRLKTYNNNNTLAFFESAILPGLGQWEKGYVGHGILNMAGEAALVGSTVYFYNSAQKYSSEVSSGGIVNSENVNLYNRNVTTYNVFLGAAITLYVFNLFQAVLLEPKNSEYVLAPTLIPINNSFAPGIELTFNF